MSQDALDNTVRSFQRYFGLPEVGGGLFTSDVNSVAGLRRPRWVKITDQEGDSPVRYSWEEQTFQPLAPGGSVSIGFNKADAGMVGTADLCPVIEPNQRALTVGEYVFVRAEYYDPTYDWVFVPISGGGPPGAPGVSSPILFAKMLEVDGLPDAAGLYDARLQDTAADGTLLDTGASVWMREAQPSGRLSPDGKYAVQRTGYDNGRDVYTVADFILVVSNSDYTQYVPWVSYLEFWPNHAWDILPAATTPAERVVRVFRIFTISQGIYPTSEEEITTNSSGLYFRHHATDVYEDDFDVQETGNQGTAYVELSGFSGDIDVLVRCDSGTGQLMKKTLSFRRGSLKYVSPESVAG